MVTGVFRRGAEDAFRRNRRQVSCRLSTTKSVLVRRTPMLGDAALRVIGDCNDAALVQIVGQGDLSGVRVDAPRRFDLVPLVIPVSKIIRVQVVPACFAVPRDDFVALVGIAHPARRAGQVIERPVRWERAVGVPVPTSWGAAPRKYAPRGISLCFP